MASDSVWARILSHLEQRATLSNLYFDLAANKRVANPRIKLTQTYTSQI